MMQFELFDELDAVLIEAEEKLSIEREQRQAALREKASQPKQCDHCSEWSPNEYLWNINHGEPSFYDLPGACVKHWAMFNQARWDSGADARQWLTERGFALPTETEKWSK
jgi:hypothetical protein